MKKSRIFSIITAVIVLLLCMTDALTEIRADQSDVDNAQSQVDSTKQEIANLKNELQNIASSITDTKSYILELDQKLDAYTASLLQCQSSIDGKQAEIEAKIVEINLKEEEITAQEDYLAEIKKDESRQYEAMKLRIQYMYENGSETFLDMIFDSDDMSDLLGKTEYFNSITEYDRKKMQELSETKDNINLILETLGNQKKALQNERKALEDSQNEMLVLKAELEAQYSYIDVIINEKTNYLTSMENQQLSQQDKIAAAEQALKEQEAVLEAARKAWEEEQKRAEANGGNADTEAEKTLEAIGLNGGFTWPIPGYNRITSEWSPSRVHPILGVTKAHDGMDISNWGIYGKPIIAAYSGTVAIADTSNSSTGYGYYVRIDHGVGVSTLYAHCSALAVTAGQYVTAGQVIGYVGSTGYSTGAHLHFSIFIKGESVNPRDYITIPTY